MEFVLIWWTVVGIVYFIPMFVALSRERAVIPVVIINVFFGFTLIGWVVALVWACTERTAREDAIHHQRSLARRSPPRG